MSTKNYKEGDLLKDQNGNPLKLFGLDYTEMVFVEAGSFKIGEKEDYEVSIEKGYFIGKYTVTQGLYERVMKNNPSYSKYSHFPVTNVDYGGLLAYPENNFFNRFKLELISDSIHPNIDGDFGLPSEIQWEYAARGGKKWNSPKLLYSGSQNLKDVAWYKDNANTLMPVGLKQPNQLGIYDMSGNVWEWCKNVRQDNNEILFGRGFALRGGCFGENSIYMEVSFGHLPSPISFTDNATNGFRLIFIPH